MYRLSPSQSSLKGRVRRGLPESILQICHGLFTLVPLTIDDPHGEPCQVGSLAFRCHLHALQQQKDTVNTPSPGCRCEVKQFAGLTDKIAY